MAYNYDNSPVAFEEHAEIEGTPSPMPNPFFNILPVIVIIMIAVFATSAPSVTGLFTVPLVIYLLFCLFFDVFRQLQNRDFPDQFKSMIDKAVEACPELWLKVSSYKAEVTAQLYRDANNISRTRNLTVNVKQPDRRFVCPITTWDDVTPVINISRNKPSMVRMAYDWEPEDAESRNIIEMWEKSILECFNRECVNVTSERGMSLPNIAKTNDLRSVVPANWRIMFDPWVYALISLFLLNYPLRWYYWRSSNKVTAKITKRLTMDPIELDDFKIGSPNPEEKAAIRIQAAIRGRRVRMNMREQRVVEGRRCYQCASQIMPDAKFCRQCGTPVDGHRDQFEQAQTLSLQQPNQLPTYDEHIGYAPQPVLEPAFTEVSIEEPTTIMETNEYTEEPVAMETKEEPQEPVVNPVAVPISRPNWSGGEDEGQSCHVSSSV